MDDKTSISSNLNDTITGMLETGEFTRLSSKMQGLAIENVRIVRKLEAGWMGHLLGTRLPNMAIYGSFILSILCVLIVIVCICATMCDKLNMDFSLEVMKLLIPVITMSLGYMFGKKDSEE